MKNNKDKNNSNYIDGRTNKKYYCKDCGKKISFFSGFYGNGRCGSCAKKGKLSPNFGKKGKATSGYIHGEYCEKHFCLDCKKEITYQTWKYEGQRCHSCGANFAIKIGRWVHKKGKQSSNYIHGQGYAPYPLEFTDELKEQIKKRDNYECQNCGMTEEEHLIVIGTDLHIHHIDYDKTNCNKENLITTCKQCNARANFNRDYWQKVYKLKIGEIKNG